MRCFCSPFIPSPRSGRLAYSPVPYKNTAMPSAKVSGCVSPNIQISSPWVPSDQQAHTEPSCNSDTRRQASLPPTPPPHDLAQLPSTGQGGVQPCWAPGTPAPRRGSLVPVSGTRRGNRLLPVCARLPPPPLRLHCYCYYYYYYSGLPLAVDGVERSGGWRDCCRRWVGGWGSVEKEGSWMWIRKRKKKVWPGS